MRVLLRGVSLAILIAGGSMIASPLPAAPDVSPLLIGVNSIGAPGIPGTVAAIGPDAAPVVAAAAGADVRADVRAPVVAAAQAGNGRIVAFGHTSFLDTAEMKAGDTGRLMTNAVRWVGRKDRPTVLVSGVPDLLAWLKDQGFHAAAGGVDRIADADVLIVSAHQIAEEEIEPISRWVNAGGGLITAATGWGWLQENPGRTLKDFPANSLLDRWGMVFTDGTVEGAGPEGFPTAPPPDALIHAGHALDAAMAAITGKTPLPPEDVPQAEDAITQAARALPAGDTLLAPRLRELTSGATGEVVPFPQRPISSKDLAGRLLLTLQVEALKSLPATEVLAHPAGAIFPGEPPSTERPVTRTVAIDTGVPDWHSLGLYASPGARVTVQIPPEAAGKGLGVRIGCHTDTLWRLDRWERVPEITRVFPLDAAETLAANAFGGLVYITVPDNCKLGTISVTVGGAVDSPLFVRGHTSPAEWREIRKRPGPWAELATDKIILTMPSRVVRTLDDPEALMAYWDAGMDAVADLAGIPRKRRRPERIVADQQISAGYMHSGYPIMTWLDVVDMDVDRGRLMKGDWGHWHEIGHNHQVSDWTFEGTGEVTNNMFPLYVNQMVAHIPGGLAHPNVQPAWQKKAIARYIAGGANFEKWKSDPFLALAMYIQLRDAFGWDAYKKVFAEYRTLTPQQRPKTDLEKRDQWMVRFSRIVHRNLGPFFQAWGVPTSQAARDSIANLPPWMPPNFPPAASSAKRQP